MRQTNKARDLFPPQKKTIFFIFNQNYFQLKVKKRFHNCFKAYFLNKEEFITRDFIEQLSILYALLLGLACAFLTEKQIK